MSIRIQTPVHNKFDIEITETTGNLFDDYEVMLKDKPDPNDIKSVKLSDNKLTYDESLITNADLFVSESEAENYCIKNGWHIGRYIDVSEYGLTGILVLLPKEWKKINWR